MLEAATPLQSDDAEGTAVVLDALAREGIKLRTGVEIAKVSRALAKVRVVLGTQRQRGDDRRVASVDHRRASAEHGGAEPRCRRYSHQSHGIVLDKSLRTTNKSVYAVGDAAGGPKYVHIADYHASLVIRHALFRVQSALTTRSSRR